MLTTPPSRWTVHGLTFVLWAAAAASTVAWGLKLSGNSLAAPVAAAPARAPAVADPAAIARLLGSVPAATAAIAVPSLASRFQLVGVVSRAARGGMALIAVDGKPARPFRVGATIDEGLVLQAVEGRRARLGPGVDAPSTLTLELPPVRR